MSMKTDIDIDIDINAHKDVHYDYDNQLFLPYLECVELKVYNPTGRAIDTPFGGVYVQRLQKMFGLTQ